MIVENNRMTDCPCASACERHGNCCECVAHHFGKGNLPACLRDVGKKRKAEEKLERKRARR
jgi:hypothetical protein